MQRPTKARVNGLSGEAITRSRIPGLLVPTHPRDGSRPSALTDFFDHALVSPVLTAHPTEVRRQSTRLRELEIADLLDERDRAVDPAELAANEEKLRCAVLILWRTNLLRQTKLKVVDEVVERPLLLRPHVLP